MTMNAADMRLLAYLQAETRTGKRKITIPAFLLENATQEGLAEARCLAKLAGCELEVQA